MGGVRAGPTPPVVSVPDGREGSQSGVRGREGGWKGKGRVVACGSGMPLFLEMWDCSFLDHFRNRGFPNCELKTPKYHYDGDGERGLSKCVDVAPIGGCCTRPALEHKKIQMKLKNPSFF